MNPEIPQRADVVVVGSGIAGLSAAIAAHELGLSAVVLEKTPHVGNATTHSLGFLWVPRSHLAEAAGLSDSLDDAAEYLRLTGAGMTEPEHVRAYVETAAEALRFYCEAGIPFKLLPGMRDTYFPELGGSTASGRMVEMQPVSLRALGAAAARIDMDPSKVPGEMGRTHEQVMADGKTFLRVGGGLDADAEHDIVTYGPATAAAFYAAALARAIPIAFETAADRLVQDGDGRVVGVEARTADGTRTFRAARGVVLAAGGYESNPQLVKNLDCIVEGMDYESQFPPSHTGDALVAAVEIGASLRAHHPNCTSQLGYRVTDANGSSRMKTASRYEFSRPHTMIVNPAGRRFGNEAFSALLAAGHRHLAVWEHEFPNTPAYLIFDSQYTQESSFADLPFGEVPDWVARADTLEGLAEQLDVDPAGLRASAERFNGFARDGADEDFDRGGAYVRLGQLDERGGNPSLGTIERPPFYGLKLVVTTQSSAGLVTTTDAQVVHLRGGAIPGLYATGNVAIGLDFGAGYQTGVSLGRGMIFSYRAVRQIADAA